ncbi:hypothetical protein AB3S75_032593 [Citrus x aurantiifolia]
MKRNYGDEEEEEEEERELLINLKVVEYLQPVMSKELLCKFPDNSAFDFDYSQSSIWSPLIPRTYSPMDLDHLVTPRKLSNDLDFDKRGIIKKSAHKKKMIASPAFKFNPFKKTKMKNKRIRASEFSATPVNTSCLPISTKGWTKMLKAASKHFKKKKKDAGMQAKLSNCLMEASKNN